MPQSLPLNWDLDAIFPGGATSPELARFLQETQSDLAALGQRAGSPAIGSEPAQLEPGGVHAGWPSPAHLVAAQSIWTRLDTVLGFAQCLLAQNVQDEPARLLLGRATALDADLRAVWARLDQSLAELSDQAFAQLLAAPELAAVTFQLGERRRRAALKLPVAQEILAGQLGVDGYHAWGELYEAVVGRVQVTLGSAGQEQVLSAGQAYNRFRLSPERPVRAAAFAAWEKAWDEQAELCAAALNHLGGFRLALYRARGWDSVLQEPLQENYMQAGTLQAMWTAVQTAQAGLLPYLQRKAQLLGVPALAWYDLEAPLAGAAPERSYDEAAAFVLEHFQRFSPGLADFAHAALRNRWVEAENRPGKGAGAFCQPLPAAAQSRVFLTYEGEASVLAHELGHAYHTQVTADLPPLALPNTNMALAEVPSTFAELIVSSAAIAAAPDLAGRRALLASRLDDAVAYFMNIHARFVFEQAFYAARRSGPLSTGQLRDLMLQAQRGSYHGALTEYHPLLWAAKGHFYATGQPFYNFPYTVGFLFSAGLYARAQAEGAGFAERYVGLLRDMGRMDVETLAQRHLGVDLTGPAFWTEATGIVLAQVAEFLSLS